MNNKLKNLFGILLTCTWVVMVALYCVAKSDNFYKDSAKTDIESNENVILVGHRKFILNTSTRVYEVNGKAPIWLYWDDENVPIFARILIENIKCVNHEFEIVLVHDSTLADYWPDVPIISFMKLSKNHRSDVLRVFVIYKYGGIYLDIDTYAMHSFIYYYHLLVEYDLIGATWYSDPIAVGHLGPARSNLTLFKMCNIMQLELIEKKRHLLFNDSSPYPFDWGELMSITLSLLSRHLLKYKALKYYAIDGPSTVGQLVTRTLSKSFIFTPLLNLSSPLYQLKQTPVLYIHHSAIGKSLDESSLEELLPMSAEETIFGYLMKCTLKQCVSESTVPNSINISAEYLLQFVRIPPIYQCFSFS